ncbi:hypothetical protein [Methanobrevibacter sp.]|uniref:hypothetical protein n=1 Tax=Methanobrevibacter sp. TaxID=66852 RepID=UPI00386FACBC
MTRTPKYYTRNKNSGGYQIKKRFGYDWKYYGYCENEEDAITIVEELKKLDWDETKLSPELKKKLSPQSESKGYYRLVIDDKFKGYTIRYNKKNYGTYPSETEVKIMVSELKKVNWNIYDLPLKFKRVLLEKLRLWQPLKPKYYSFNKANNMYMVQKWNGKKLEVFGLYDTAAEAMMVVDKLKLNNWDKECLI